MARLGCLALSNTIASAASFSCVEWRAELAIEVWPFLHERCSLHRDSRYLARSAVTLHGLTACCTPY